MKEGEEKKEREREREQSHCVENRENFIKVA